MNLADIRKKAGKETELSPVATVGEEALSQGPATGSVTDADVVSSVSLELSEAVLPSEETEPGGGLEMGPPPPGEPPAWAGVEGADELLPPQTCPSQEEPPSFMPQREVDHSTPDAGEAPTDAPLSRQEVEQVPVFAAYNPLALLLAGREEDAAGVDEWESEEGDSSGEAVVEYLCFRVSDELYAVNIMEIKEIIRPREATEVPRAPSFISGVLSLRGIIIPVFDMRRRLGLPPVLEGGKERVVVVKQQDGFCGILVDEVVQVVRIPVSTIEPAPAVLEGIDRDFVLGIGHYDEKMIILLSLEHILNLSLATG